MLGTTLVGIIIIALNVIISMKGFKDRAFFEKYMFNVGRIYQHKEYYRLITSGFLHVSYMHLFFNMFTMFFFAGTVTRFFSNPFSILGDGEGNIMLGNILFTVLYFLSIVAGNLLSLTYHKNQPYYSAVGASGGVSGIVFSSIVVNPTMMILIFFIPMPAWIFAFLYLGYSVYGMRKEQSGIGHAAHLGGSIIGYVATLLFFPQLLEINQFYILIMAIPIVVMIIMMVMQKQK